MINELKEKAKEELKRADHLVFVTLKYTRTCDVIKNTIKRLISAYEFSIEEALEYLKQKKKISVIPVSVKAKVELFSKHYRKFKEYTQLYYLLRTIDRTEYNTCEEYRKNVTLITKIEGKEYRIDITVLTSYFEKTKEFVSLVNNEVE